MKKTMRYGLLASCVMVPLVILSGCNVGQYDEPAYMASAAAEDGIELRDYAPMLVAQVEVTGERKEAISQGFRMIADYIFGNNVPKQSISMTAPVLQQAAEKPEGKKIAMTAPVIQQGVGVNRWVVQFVMPPEYTLATLPKPNNDAVKLLEVKGKRMVAIRFSGSTKDENVMEHQKKLADYVAAQGLKTVGEPVMAFYDPPWTLPFMRRNEVLYELAPDKQKH